ncbi:DUF6795 domain-containing protein [Pseudoalteromonas prydzensis]|uniref:DUF6795 domain-containing protein n=1 Tax=Pseudoalteromonas prydzensis TaxID=182141 RepID=A0ABR9FL60_9GAMM|nr:DUF6795 domain-containing protein [Pseudoalteromonas prydzensis]MBE0457522.1 hypothetical protein [Pseudoalteromonas prydzensis]
MSLIDKLQSFSVKIQPFLDKFGAYKVHLCPEVKGRLTNNGKPIDCQLISRSLNFSDGKARKDFTYTDHNGNFTFPEKTIRSDQPSIPLSEIFTNQYITSTYNNHKYIIWRATLIGQSPINEFNNKLNCLNGDINNEAIFFRFPVNSSQTNYEGTSICRWDKDFEIINIDEYFNLSEESTQ